MNDMKIFENAEFGAVRVVDVNGEPWFVAKDVCECLELGNPRTSIALLDEDEKGVHTMDTPVFQAVPEEWKGVHRMHTPGGGQEMLIISEQGLYFFLARSDKEAALPYQMWVAGDVCECLELTNTSQTLSYLDDDEKGITTNDTPNDAVNTHCKKVNKFSYGDMPQGAQPYNIIPESDVYRLVMRKIQGFQGR